MNAAALSSEIVTQCMTADAPQPQGKGVIVPLLRVPSEDLAEFCALPAGVQARVNDLLFCYSYVETCANKDGALRRVAKDERIAGQVGFSFPRLRASYYNWLRHGRDWRVCVDCARTNLYRRLKDGSVVKCGDNCDKLPAEFLKWWKGKAGKNQRVSAAAHRKFVEAWHSGDSVPGFGTWQQYFQREHPFATLPALCPGLPKGCTLRNLMRYRPTDTELAAERQGISAAMQHLPRINQSTTELRPMEEIVFDDVRADWLIVIPPHIVELKALVAMDVATRMILGFYLRPALPKKDDDDKRDGLVLADMKYLAAQLLAAWGYPTEYKCKFIVENGTATFQPADADALAQFTGGQVIVSWTSMINGTLQTGGFTDRGVGNPMGKAWLESTFNLFHNEAGDVPGQMGRRYDEGPSELHGRKAETRALIRLAGKLPARLAEQLKYPFPTFEQARTIVRDVFLRIMSRTDHDIEGFAKNVLCWRYEKDQPYGSENGGWGTQADLDAVLIHVAPDAREAFKKNLHVALRKESPVEKFARTRAEHKFARFPDCVLWRFMDKHDWQMMTNGEISFKINGAVRRWWDPMRKIVAHDGKYLCHWDPQNLDMLHLTDGKGAYVGTIPAKDKVARGEFADPTVLAEREAILKHQFNALKTEINSRHPDEIAESLERRQHNNDVLANATAMEMNVAGDATLQRSDAVRTRVPRAAEAITSIVDQVAARRAARTAAKRQEDAAVEAISKDDALDLL